MLQPSSMLSRLDMETRAHHREVDAYWLDLMAVGVTRDQYKAHLVRTYGFEAPLESALAYTPQLVIADRRDRVRSGLIAQDLLALGITPAKVTALPQCRDIEPFENPAEALGWKYVIERPTQMHAAIKRNLINHVGELANACAYLSVCDGIAGARWQQFGSLLDDVAEDHQRASTSMIEGAHRAFSCMIGWFRRSGQLAAVAP